MPIAEETSEKRIREIAVNAANIIGTAIGINYPQRHHSPSIRIALLAGIGHALGPVLHSALQVVQVEPRAALRTTLGNVRSALEVAQERHRCTEPGCTMEQRVKTTIGLLDQLIAMLGTPEKPRGPEDVH